MKIARSAAKERIVLDALRASFVADGVRTGVHLSDLLKVRLAHWGRVMPIPPSDSDCLYFLAGRGHEEVFARLAGVRVGATDVKHVPIPEFVAGEQRVKYGISYRPDFRWYGLPTEFKTRRSNLAKDGEEPVQYDNYLEQLKGYCTLDGASAGHLIVFSLLEGRSMADPLKPSAPELAVYDVEFDVAERAHMDDYLRRQKRLFEDAVMAHAVAGMPLATEDQQAHAQQAYAALPLCPPWMCGKNRKTVIRAAHCVECGKDLAEPWASKHTKTRGGAGHTVTPEEVRWDYTPRCKYYVFCRPQDVDALRGAR